MNNRRRLIRRVKRYLMWRVPPFLVVKMDVTDEGYIHYRIDEDFALSAFLKNLSRKGGSIR